MDAIEAELTAIPTRCGQLAPGHPWRVFKVRPRTEGFPGLVIYFSIETGGNTPICLLQGVKVSDDEPRLALTDYISEVDAWQWPKGNGHSARVGE